MFTYRGQHSIVDKQQHFWTQFKWNIVVEVWEVNTCTVKTWLFLANQSSTFTKIST